MKIKSFKALNDYLIVEPVVLTTKTAGGIFLPETAEDVERPYIGKVLSAGGGYNTIDVTVDAGEYVAFNRNIFTPLTMDVDGKRIELKAIRQIDALCTLEMEDD
jgi:co-chaperonin GroES (HSP10)